MSSTNVVHAKNIIAAEESKGTAGEARSRNNPATGEPVSDYLESSTEDVRAAVTSARSAFEESPWTTTPRLRAETMKRFRDAIEQNFEGLARLQTLECGKVIKDSRAELRTAIDLLDYYSGMCRNVTGRTITPDPNTMSFVMREPVGVVGIIVPWNSPLILLARSLAPALAAGNTVVVKPSSYTPGVVFELMRILSQSTEESVRGVINLIVGSGEVSGRALVSDTDVDMISFTGSTTSAKQIIADSASNIKKLSLELGGKTPNIVFDDAEFESAIRGAIRGQMLGTAGQVCFAGTRIIVQDGIYEKFCRTISEMMPKMRVGNGIDEDVEVGPLVSQNQVESVMKYVERGKEEAKLLLGGKRMSEGEFSKGYFVEPTLFAEVPPEAALATEEIFGPVISLMSFHDPSQAAHIANNSEYGLSASVWTRDVGQAFGLAKELKSGVVWINQFGRYHSEVESGGYRQSGLGRLRGVEGLNAFTQTKTIALNLDCK